MPQERVQRKAPAPTQETGASDLPKHEPTEGTTKADTEAVLDDIDSMLEEMFEFETAESFVTNYRQKGGQ